MGRGELGTSCGCVTHHAALHRCLHGRLRPHTGRCCSRYCPCCSSSVVLLPVLPVAMLVPVCGAQALIAGCWCQALLTALPAAAAPAAGAAAPSVRAHLACAPSLRREPQPDAAATQHRPGKHIPTHRVTKPDASCTRLQTHFNATVVVEETSSCSLHPPPVTP
jgi:hypothetical protein